MAFDFSAVSAPFRMQPGLRRVPPGATQLSVNEIGSRALREKLSVLSRWPEQALLCLPGFDARPALQALVRHATAEQPQALVWDGAHRFDAPLLGWSLLDDHARGRGPPEIGACLRHLPAEWRLPALLSLAFAEDFAIIDARSGRIPWLAVCLPSHWAPEDKVGRHFAEVHAPVADNQLLLTAADHLARLVTGAAHWERFVWTVTPHDGLQAHPRRCARPPWPAAADAATLAALACFRTERQTFIPVASHGQAIFTIRVEVSPLTQAIRSAERARQLHAALASMSDAVLAYRGLVDARDRLLAWLQQQADRHVA
ncbi:MAG: DUF3445 domain-containing protein [Rhizobacter sp.]|nr:DUF3445 domain-containing protein [Rhizobacter sp.]